MKRLSRIPVRIQLTVWYVFLLGLTLSGFTSYIYLRLEYKLMIKVDTSLQIGAAQALLYLDPGNRLAFQNSPNQRSLAMRLSQLGFAARIITPEGQVVNGFGRYQDVPVWVPNNSGYKTLVSNGIDWRVISQPIIREGRTIGWLQMTQSLEVLEDIARDLPTEIFLHLPFILLSAGLGGLFLSNRALRPIRNITQMAQSITASDLMQRISYQGADDEVGQLAITFDQMLDRLQASFEREQRFTSDAAHELRTPLAVIKGRISLMLSRSRTGVEYEKTLHDLQQEVDRLIRLSNGLLLLARLDRGQLPIAFTAVDLSNLLEVLTEQVQPLAEDRQIKLSNDLPAKLWIQGDPDHCTSLFLNLLDNAIKYTPEAGQVRIWSGDRQPNSEHEVRICVSNTGAGIDPQHLPHLFERFYRTDSARSQVHSGVGLGLAIAYEITRLHGGILSAESEPNQETRFTVTFPRCDALFAKHTVN
ncbi:MAG: HAMP domain-containing protein [Leptolyngbyaceae cyanobacterium SL_5_9]|nr:HAMP domain-containing protein [Leptolyngbyaceae cyanobacterium SL_5_9]NJO75029.1 HAMP domain-containing protein [Leptolyngbyaceae cyanobacterium RM1_406_9]